MDTPDVTASENVAPASRTSELVRDLILSPITNGGLVAQTVRRLGEAIGLGIFEVGARLPSENELAEQLGISAMTLREALAIMRETGYFETRRGRSGGTYVTELSSSVSERIARERLSTITDEFLADLTDFRVAIGGEGAALAAERVTSENIDELRELIQRMDSAATYAEFRQHDAAFHVTIASSSGSRRLTRAETELQAELTRLWGVFRVGPQARQTTNVEHRAILGAIEAGEPDEARRLMTAHMMSSAQGVLGFMKASHLSPPVDGIPLRSETDHSAEPDRQSR